MRSLKKPAASSKRAKLPRRVDYARRFLKDWKRLSRSGRYDMKRLKSVMLLLIANDAPLGVPNVGITRSMDHGRATGNATSAVTSF